jgi:hypothetical protein
MKGIKKKKSPFFCFHGNYGKFVQPIPIFLAYLVPLDVDVVPIKFHQFLFAEQPVMIIFVFFQIFRILAVSMATAAILKIPKVVCTSTHSA